MYITPPLEIEIICQNKLQTVKMETMGIYDSYTWDQHYKYSIKMSYVMIRLWKWQSVTSPVLKSHYMLGNMFILS